MNWKKIDKDKSTQPSNGTYSDWKEQIAKECFYQCIYCSIHEEQFGGIDHYHIEHYRPKSIKRFKKLENDIKNLFYCCPICNRFKSNDWPNDPDDLEVICYPDPSEYDYSNLIDVDGDNFKVEGKYLSTRYLIERLYLNRPQLIYERRETVLRSKQIKLVSEINHYKEKFQLDDDVVFLKNYLSIILQLQETLDKRRKIRPYKLVEIRK
ncbi:hypothetical protein [Pseudofulvibacter geojedonensis]|uniref:HNH domain-containing protein n=1 Tax=Pseudofulvibacter geojedonensis TaxID=1123758 RepID=A0ABW3HYP9_9FLAO